MKLRLLGLVALLVLSGGAQAASLNIALSNDAARFELQTNYTGLGLNNAELVYSITYNDDNDWLGGARIGVFGDAAAPGSGLHAGAGVSLMLGDANQGEILTVGIGGQLRYVFPEANRFALAAQGFVAPEITSFLDSEGYMDWSVQLDYELTREARLFLGYRDIEIDLENGVEVDLESGFFAGLKIIF